MRWNKLLLPAVFVACSDGAPAITGDAGAPAKKDASALVSDASSSSDAGVSACSPAAAPTSFFALDSYDLGKSRDVSMCEYRGDVIMVVNTASYCGYTPEYTPLEKIFEKYMMQGFVVLGFPCDQFGAQEPGEDSDISTFCTQEYGIKFPMFTKSDVNVPDQNPIYTWLKTDASMNVDGGQDITWNFNKFLLSRKGEVIARYDSPVEPDDPSVTAAIEAELAKPIPQF
jgi:glutathione peroxidase